MLKRVAIGLIAVVVVAAGGVGAFAWRPAIGEVTPPSPSAFTPALVAQGEVLAAAGYCATCHTAKGGAPYAGGYPMKTAFGTVYSSNITPDAKTGIGAWSEAAFRRAMHDGVARNGAHLFPAFPYDHFTKLSDADVTALYAFIMTRPAVAATPPANTVPFPLSIRALQAGWKLLFFRPGRFQPDPSKSEAWNRGAYLAEGVSHCGACHTPRNSLGAEQRSMALSGALIDNWIAPALTSANPSPAPWDETELAAYLHSGISRYHGVAAGPMGPVVHDGLSRLPGADIQALAVYFADVGGAAARTPSLTPALDKAAAADRLNTGPQADPSARLYTAACASCHYNGAGQPNPLRPDLGLNSAIYLDDPTNLIRVILYGLDAKEGAPGVVMPGFAGWPDGEVARLAAYLRATRTGKAPWPDLEKKVASIRAQGK